MQERINEIIEFLMREIAQLREPLGHSIEKLSKKLLKKGYTEGEIHKAVEWVILNLDKPQKPAASRKFPHPGMSLRVLIPEEMQFFSPPAYGYLIQLQTLGIISPLQVDLIIERCFLMGLSQAGVDEVKTVVSQLLLGKELGTFDTDSVYHPGNDTIN